MPKVSPEDRALFREAVKKLKFVSPRSLKSQKSASSTTSASSLAPTSIELYDHNAEYVTPTENLFYSRGGLQHKTLKDLRTGKLNIQAELDLHGLNSEEARTALSRFIERAHDNRLKTIQIIHGKGEILKNHVNLWLKQIKTVLAFSSAIPKHGGTGAVVVILKQI